MNSRHSGEPKTFPTSLVSRRGTGDTRESPLKKLCLSYDKYEIDLAVTDDDRVVGVIEIRHKQDFRSMQQKLASSEYLDVEKYYAE